MVRGEAWLAIIAVFSSVCRALEKHSDQGTGGSWNKSAFIYDSNRFSQK
jgi:hypothetical protein